MILRQAEPAITPPPQAAPSPGAAGPAHPGIAIRHACLKPFRLSVTEAASALGVTRKTLSDVVNGHNGISAPMAIRLEQAFGGTADAWLRMQLQYDLWRARQRPITINRRYTRPAPP